MYHLFVQEVVTIVSLSTDVLIHVFLLVPPPPLLIFLSLPILSDWQEVYVVMVSFLLISIVYHNSGCACASSFKMNKKGESKFVKQELSTFSV